MGRLTAPPSPLFSNATRQAKRRQYDRSRAAQPWRRWYGLAAWRRRRADQLAGEPLCRLCRQAGQVTAATVADHIEPHRGDWQKFIRGRLQSLCGPCHSSIKQAEEQAPPWHPGR